MRPGACADSLAPETGTPNVVLVVVLVVGVSTTYEGRDACRFDPDVPFGLMLNETDALTGPGVFEDLKRGNLEEEGLELGDDVTRGLLPRTGD